MDKFIADEKLEGVQTRVGQGWLNEFWGLKRNSQKCPFEIFKNKIQYLISFEITQNLKLISNKLKKVSMKLELQQSQ